MTLAIQSTHAKLNVTFGGQNGDLPDGVDYDSSEESVLGWATEALRTGGIPGIDEAPTADLSNFVVDRFPATDARPYPLISVRPKTPFGYHV